MTDDTCTISTVNFLSREVKEKIDVPHDTGIPQILRSMADYAAKNGVESIVIATIEGGNVCNECFHIKDEGQMTLMALYLEDIRQQLKLKIFNEVEEDEGAV
jgi:hypothetical protein